MESRERLACLVDAQTQWDVLGEVTVGEVGLESTLAFLQRGAEPLVGNARSEEGLGSGDIRLVTLSAGGEGRVGLPLARNWDQGPGCPTVPPALPPLLRAWGQARSQSRQQAAPNRGTLRSLPQDRRRRGPTALRVTVSVVRSGREGSGGNC